MDEGGAATRAPDLAGRGGWIGVEPLSLTALRGKIVLLHFWTAGSVDSLRVLEQLRRLELLFADELVVIGVHAPKFPRGADHGAVVSAAARHHVAHPVLDDPEGVTWDRYGVEEAPALVLVDPEGSVVDAPPGADGRAVERTIGELVAAHEARGTLRPAPFEMAPVTAGAGVLAFPGKVAASADGQRLAIADTGHDRVLVCSIDGLALESHTGFSGPQGVRFDGDHVVVCSTGGDRVVHSSGVTLAHGIASPWDLAGEDDGSWLVAAAGGHRLMRIRPGELQARVAAGTGARGLADGLAVKAQLAQPSGLARTASATAFVDADSSALRLLGDDGRVVTLAGAGLFEWGAEDGPADRARLQHPLGVAAGHGRLYVADTFNCRLRAWEEGRLETLPVEGLEEPGGLDVLPDGRLVVADTNHHRVVVVDPGTGAVTPVEIDESWLTALECDPVAVAAGGRAGVAVSLDLGGEELDRAGGPVQVVVDARPQALVGGGPARAALPGPQGLVEVRGGRPGTGVLLVEVSVPTRGGGGSRVRVRRRRHRLTVG